MYFWAVLGTEVFHCQTDDLTVRVYKERYFQCYCNLMNTVIQLLIKKTYCDDLWRNVVLVTKIPWGHCIIQNSCGKKYPKSYDCLFCNSYMWYIISLQCLFCSGGKVYNKTLCFSNFLHLRNQAVAKYLWTVCPSLKIRSRRQYCCLSFSWQIMWSIHD